MIHIVRAFLKLLPRVPDETLCLFSLHPATSTSPTQALITLPVAFAEDTLDCFPSPDIALSCYLYQAGETTGWRLSWPPIYYEDTVWSLVFTGTNEEDFEYLLRDRPCRRLAAQSNPF